MLPRRPLRLALRRKVLGLHTRLLVLIRFRLGALLLSLHCDPPLCLPQPSLLVFLLSQARIEQLALEDELLPLLLARRRLLGADLGRLHLQTLRRAALALAHRRLRRLPSLLSLLTNLVGVLDKLSPREGLHLVLARRVLDLRLAVLLLRRPHLLLPPLLGHAELCRLLVLVLRHLPLRSRLVRLGQVHQSIGR